MGSFFMQDLIMRKTARIKANVKHIAVFFAALLLGIIFGVISYVKEFEYGVLYEGAFNYYYNIFGCAVNPFTVLLKRILTVIGSILLFFLLGLTIYAYPFEFIIIFYRGLIIGSMTCIFYSIYSLYGVALFIIVTIPQNVVNTFGLVTCGILNYDYHANSQCRKLNVREVFTNAVMGFVICTVGALYEFTVLALIIRPFSFYL